jgi:hypothetical protein
MWGFASNAQRVFVYHEVDLPEGAVLRLRGTPGVDVRGETSALCVTIDRRLHAFPDVGRAYRIESGGTAVVSAFRATRVVLAGELRSTRAWRIELVPPRGGAIVLAEDRPRRSLPATASARAQAARSTSPASA